MIGPIFTYARSGDSCKTMWVRKIIHVISVLCLFMFSCAAVYLCLVITYWEGADLLAFVFDV